MIAALADARDDSGGGCGAGAGASASCSSRGSSSGGAPQEEGGVRGRGRGDQAGGVWDGERRDKWRGDSVRVFDDPTEATAGGGDGGRGAAAVVVPPLREITAFYRNLYHRTCLKFDSIVLSLIYVERLMKVRVVYSCCRRAYC